AAISTNAANIASNAVAISTNAANIASNAAAIAEQKAGADLGLTSLQPEVTNTWTVGPHLDWLVNSYTPTNAFTWSLSGSNAIITAYSGSYASIRVPPYIDGHPVTEIADSVFAVRTMVDVVLPSTLRVIGSSAFANSGNLASIDIPAGVTNIGAAVFNGCSSLAAVTIPAGLTVIEESAFSGMSIVSLAIPDRVERISATAFSACASLPVVVIPASVTNIGASAFDSCSALQAIYFQGAPPTLGAIFSGLHESAVVYHLAGYDFGATFGSIPTAVYGPALVDHPTVANVAGALVAQATNTIAAGNLSLQRIQVWDWGCSSNRFLVLTNDVLEIWEP
ncbi:MAG: leucine-rich repeat domain-containing protein, partial [Kiritimatiellae bacterium]|nr:leucine-rich repeat domain-containing protein [Kiritimatiellia bacterium]